MTYYSRADWGARPPEDRYAFGGSDVEGIALHWPAMGKTRRTTVAQVMASLRGWQDYHMDTKGWSDIGYQEAVDQDGNAYELRGLDHRSGANGDRDVNTRFGALLLVLGEGEEPSAAMMAAARSRIARHRQLHPSSHLIVGHGQIRPGGTQCPGPIVQRLINEGAFEPTQEEALMVTKEDEQKIAQIVRANVGSAQLKDASGQERPLQQIIRHMLIEQDRLRAAVLNPDDIAQRVVAKLPKGSTNITAADLARAFIAELSADDAEG